LRVYETKPHIKAHVIFPASVFAQGECIKHFPNCTDAGTEPQADFVELAIVGIKVQIRAKRFPLIQAVDKVEPVLIDFVLD
jgi:hypothetical protein